MRLEALAEEKITTSTYPYLIEKKQFPWIINFFPLFEHLLSDIKQRKNIEFIATKFHNTLVELIGKVAEAARNQFKVDTVVLSGGVFLNSFLLRRVEILLQEKGFQVLRPQLYSPNDESLSLGQIAYALNYLRRNKDKK